MQSPATNIKNKELIGSHELREITELLVKHHGLHEGIYDLALEFQIAVGGMGVDPLTNLPGVMFNVKRIGIVKAHQVGASTVDAAEANPTNTSKPNVKTASAVKKVKTKKNVGK